MNSDLIDLLCLFNRSFASYRYRWVIYNYSVPATAIYFYDRYIYWRLVLSYISLDLTIAILIICVRWKYWNSSCIWSEFKAVWGIISWISWHATGCPRMRRILSKISWFVLDLRLQIIINSWALNLEIQMRINIIYYLYL